jgi:2-polyprenyl-3-methyl-5-hydroxy-6-metoxy-1,4-benzoquinol methylase
MNRKIEILTKLDTRIPNWGKVDNKRFCPICGFNGEPRFSRPDNLIVNECDKCYSYYISPAPTEKDLNIFYSKYHENHSLMPRISPEELKLMYDKIDSNSIPQIKKLESILNFENLDVLDIGFGQPLLLYLLKKKGAKTTGIDLDPTAVEYAKYLKIDRVLQGDVNEYSPTKLHDVVIMTDFVEHPLNPMDYIKKSLEFLKVGGKILIWTPNGNSEIKHKNPVTFRVDLEHMQYFTNQTIQFISNELDLKILHLETRGHPNLDYSEKNKFKTGRIPMYGLNYKLKKYLKIILFDYLLKKNYVIDNSKVPIGNYHLFTILEKKH